MQDLRRRFGQLVKAHRQRVGLTQGELAERADISVNMIAKIEGATSGARFAVIEKIADALEIDAAELFTMELPRGRLRRKELLDITSRLALLTDDELVWIRGVIEAALKAP
jgi:transcriptional regulator with XRE-family HTH domain